MYSLKGFINIPKFVNNNPISGNMTVPGISPIGEISKWGLTFSKDVEEFASAVYPDVHLISLFSKDSLQGEIQAPATMVTQALKVAQWVFHAVTTASTPYTLQTLNDALFAAFFSEINTVTVNDLTTVNIGNVNLTFPQSISWIDQITGNTLKVWFSDFAFCNQFDEYEIVVVPPIDVAHLDDFFLTPNVAMDRLKNISTSDWANTIEVAKARNPETFVRIQSYDYKCALYPGITYSTDWSFIIYGAAGDNVDILKDALIKYILANSTHTQAEWVQIFPDIFKRTEFVIIPKWNQYAIPEMVVQQGLYSPIIKLDTAFTLFKQVIPEYPATHVDSYLTSLGHPYKSIALLCIGSPDNRDGKFLITDYFPDYINVGTNSLDFNRMQAFTKDFFLLLEYMLIMAETVTDFSTIDTSILTGFTYATPVVHKVKRNSNIFISAMFENVQFLVAAKRDYSI